MGNEGIGGTASHCTEHIGLEVGGIRMSIGDMREYLDIIWISYVMCGYKGISGYYMKCTNI